MSEFIKNQIILKGKNATNIIKQYLVHKDFGLYIFLNKLGYIKEGPMLFATQLTIGSDNECSVMFATKIAPHIVIRELFNKYPNLDIKYQYAGNYFGSDCGMSFIVDNTLNEITFKDFSEESYAIAKDLFGTPMLKEWA